MSIINPKSVYAHYTDLNNSSYLPPTHVWPERFFYLVLVEAVQLLTGLLF